MRSNFTKMIAATVGAAALIVPMSACGSSGGADAQNKLTVYSYYNKDTMQPIVTAFEKANPGVKVEISYGTGSDAYDSTLQTRIAGNQAPDVFNLSGNNFHDLADNGAAADLTGESFLEGVDDTYLKDYSKDGKVYGLTISGWLGGIAYNKELVSKAGFDAVPDTMDDFTKLAKALKDQGITPYMENGEEMSASLVSLIGSTSGKTGTDTFSGVKNITKPWQDGLEAWDEGYIKSGVLPPESVGMTGDQVKQSFLNGEVAMYRTGGWDIADFKEAGIDYGFAPFPGAPGREANVNGGADPAFAISATTKKRELAEKFLSFINSEEGVKLFTTAYGSASISSKYESELNEQIKPLYDDYFFKGKYYWISFSKASVAMTTEVKSQQQGVQGGQITPDEAAKNINAKWESVQ